MYRSKASFSTSIFCSLYSFNLENLHTLIAAAFFNHSNNAIPFTQHTTCQNKLYTQGSIVYKLCLYLSSQWLLWTKWKVKIIELGKTIGKLLKWCNSDCTSEIKSKRNLREKDKNLNDALNTDSVVESIESLERNNTTGTNWKFKKITLRKWSLKFAWEKSSQPQIFVFVFTKLQTILESQSFKDWCIYLQMVQILFPILMIQDINQTK